MIPLQERKQITEWITIAIESGARQHKACEIIGLSERTFQRWHSAEAIEEDGRKTRRFTPVNKLSAPEREKLLATANSEEFKDKSPHQIVAILAERGEYIASEATFYRALREANQLAHRHATKPSSKRHKPEAVCATAPRQVFSWDITYLKTTVVGQFFYLYLFMDVFSRKIVGWQIHDYESSELASHIIHDIAAKESIRRDQIILHSDNGGPMKGATMLATLQQLGIMPSFSRPSVSDDNPYSEALFKTVKYCPYYPSRPFESVTEARKWMATFVDWYNHEHRHSGIKYVTPAQRHAGLDEAILAQRTETYEQAKERHPERWAKGIRNWERETVVYLNPDKKPETNGEIGVRLAS